MMENNKPRIVCEDCGIEMQDDDVWCTRYGIQCPDCFMKEIDKPFNERGAIKPTY